MSAELREALAGLTADKFVVEWFAVDKYGIPIAPESPTACRWCTAGWFMKSGSLPGELATEALDVALSLGYETLTDASYALGYEFVKLLREEGDDDPED